MGASAETDYRVEWIDNLEDFSKIGREWDALVSRVPGATVFQSHIWLSTALASLSGRQPCVGVIRRDQDLLGALPLDLGWDRYSGLPLRTARTAGYPMTDRHVFLAEDAQTVGHLLEAALRLPADMLLLAETLESETVSGAVRSWLAGRGVSALSRRASVARCVPLTAETSDELYRSYSTKHRANVRRSRRRLEETGELEIEILRPTVDEIPAFVSRLKSVEDDAWQGTQGTGLFSTAKSASFFGGFFSGLAAKGDVWASMMTLDGEDVMYVLGMTHDACFYWYGTAYRPERIKGSAYHVVGHDLMIALRRAGIACFDSSRNTPDRENALDRLNPEMLEHRHFALFRPTPLGVLHRLILVRALPVYRRLRSAVAPKAQGMPAALWRFEPAKS